MVSRHLRTRVHFFLTVDFVPNTDSRGLIIAEVAPDERHELLGALNRFNLRLSAREFQKLRGKR